MCQKAIGIFLMLSTNRLIYYLFRDHLLQTWVRLCYKKVYNEDTFDNIGGIQQARRGEREQLVVRCKV